MVRAARSEGGDDGRGGGLTQASTCEAGLVPLAGVAAAAAIAALGLARYQPAKTVAVAERVEPLLSA